MMLDGNKKTVGRHSGASVDLSRLPAASVAQNVLSLVKEISRLTNTSIRECGGVCFSMDAALVKPNEAAVAKMFKNIGFSCPVKIVCGERALLAAKAGNSAGMLVTSGADVAGYILREDSGETFHGNYGYIIETPGSGHAIGASALRRVFAAFDGRAKDTALTALITKHFNVKTVPEILPIIKHVDFDPKVLSELSAHVKTAGLSGDKAALEIETQAAHGLAGFAKPMIEAGKKTGDRTVLVLGGPTLMLNESLFRQASALLRSLFPDIQILPGDEKPEAGAAALAMIDRAKNK
jgi:N-acetylglucosamine kinase-like BadF-type ATPase